LEQKDCILIQTPQRKNALILSRNFLQPEFDFGGNIISPALWDAGVRGLDKLILTDLSYLYQDEIITLVKNFRIKEIITNGQEYETREYLDFIELIKNEKIPLRMVRYPDRISLDKEVEITVLNPVALLPENIIRDIDNNSLVLKLSYQKFKILFMGNIRDMELLKDRDLESTVLVFPHQGEYAISKRLLSSLRPEIGIISGGRGHLDLRNLSNCYSTADSGAITITTDGRKYQIKSSLGDIALRRLIKDF